MYKDRIKDNGRNIALSSLINNNQIVPTVHSPRAQYTEHLSSWTYEGGETLILPIQDGPHQINFLLLAFHDCLAEGLDFMVSDIGLTAHKDYAGIMRDHGS